MYAKYLSFWFSTKQMMCCTKDLSMLSSSVDIYFCSEYFTWNLVMRVAYTRLRPSQIQGLWRLTDVLTACLEKSHQALNRGILLSSGKSYSVYASMFSLLENQDYRTLLPVTRSTSCPIQQKPLFLCLPISLCTKISISIICHATFAWVKQSLFCAIFSSFSLYC